MGIKAPYYPPSPYPPKGPYDLTAESTGSAEALGSGSLALISDVMYFLIMLIKLGVNIRTCTALSISISKF